ncbi:Inhibitory synaptic factor 1 [Camelus dromedarius]|uniref:Inhibitory synaptic factor 1 n=1 Tax=Camelus dromedarius TaxID=9838 RepID=A0A5N4CFM8_CAMDR|nr:Inhibitory synaptic factor 1 [Camelus dromedarius]
MGRPAHVVKDEHSGHPGPRAASDDPSSGWWRRRRIRQRMKMVIGQLEGILRELKDVPGAKGAEPSLITASHIARACGHVVKDEHSGTPDLGQPSDDPSSGGERERNSTTHEDVIGQLEGILRELKEVARS